MSWPIPQLSDLCPGCGIPTLSFTPDLSSDEKPFDSLCDNHGGLKGRMTDDAGKTVMICNDGQVYYRLPDGLVTKPPSVSSNTPPPPPPPAPSTPVFLRPITFPQILVNLPFASEAPSEQEPEEFEEPEKKTSYAVPLAIVGSVLLLAAGGVAVASSRR